MDTKELKRILNKNFKRSREFIEETLEIKLTNIELLELRKLNEFCHNLYIRDCDLFLPDGFLEDKTSINPYLESALIFMNKNYGTQINYPEGDYEKLNYNKTKYGFEGDIDYYSCGFQKIQDEMHNRIGY
jgi:hypothetical protein